MSVHSVSREAFRKNARFVFRTGVRIKGRFFHLVWKKTENLSISRVVVIIGKKIIARASERNLWRRRVRAASIQTTTNQSQKGWLVFVAQQPLKHTTHPFVVKEIAALLNKIPNHVEKNETLFV